MRREGRVGRVKSENSIIALLLVCIIVVSSLASGFYSDAGTVEVSAEGIYQNGEQPADEAEDSKEVAELIPDSDETMLNDTELAEETQLQETDIEETDSEEEFENDMEEWVQESEIESEEESENDIEEEQEDEDESEVIVTKSVEVGNWDSLVSAVADETVDEIVLTSSFSQGTNGADLAVIRRSLRIVGQGKRLTIRTNASDGYPGGFILGELEDEGANAVLELVDIEYYMYSSPYFALIEQETDELEGWYLKIDSVRSVSTNTAGIAAMAAVPDVDVVLSGENYVHKHGSANAISKIDYVHARNITLKAGGYFEAHESYAGATGYAFRAVENVVLERDTEFVTNQYGGGGICAEQLVVKDNVKLNFEGDGVHISAGNLVFGREGSYTFSGNGVHIDAGQVQGGSGSTIASSTATTNAGSGTQIFADIWDTGNDMTLKTSGNGSHIEAGLMRTGAGLVLTAAGSGKLIIADKVDLGTGGRYNFSGNGTYMTAGSIVIGANAELVSGGTGTHFAADEIHFGADGNYNFSGNGRHIDAGYLGIGDRTHFAASTTTNAAGNVTKITVDKIILGTGVEFTTIGNGTHIVSGDFRIGKDSVINAKSNAAFLNSDGILYADENVQIDIEGGSNAVKADRAYFESNVKFNVKGESNPLYLNGNLHLGDSSEVHVVQSKSGTAVTVGTMSWGQGVVFTGSAVGNMLQANEAICLDESLEWKLAKTGSGFLIGGGSVKIDAFPGDKFLYSGTGNVVKAEEILISANSELQLNYTGNTNIFSADRMIVENGAVVETGITSPASNPSSYIVQDLIIEENATLKNNTVGAAYGLQVRDLTIKQRAVVELTASGASNAAIYVINKGHIEVEEGRLSIHNSGTNKKDTTAGSGGIFGAVESVIFDHAVVEIDAYADAFRTNVSCSMEVINGSQVNLSSDENSGLGMYVGTTLGSSANLQNHVKVSGRDTTLRVFSADKTSSADGAAMYVEGDGSSIHVTDGALFSVRADNGGRTNYNSAVQIEGVGAVLKVDKKATMHLSTAKSNVQTNPVLRFRLEGGMTLDIDDAEVYIESEGGSASGIRFYGGDNYIYVKNGGYLSVEHGGDGSSNNAVSRGIHYLAGSGTVNAVHVTGKNAEGKASALKIHAASGPAIFSSSNVKMDFYADEDTVFDLYGNTNSDNYGVINSNGVLYFTIHEPEYFDIRNANFRRPAITDNDKTGTFEATGTTLSFWDAGKGNDWNGDPDLTFPRMTHVNLQGKNFSTVVSVDSRVSDLFQREYSGKGMKDYNRISANNGKPIVDDLRISTDADQRIYGHVMIPEGRENAGRDAWEGEVHVLVEVLDGEDIIYGPLMGTTQKQVSAFGIDEVRNGMFEIELPGEDDFLEAGQIISVIAVWRGEAADTLEEALSNDQNIISTDLSEIYCEVQKVVPPSALTIDQIDHGALITIVDDNGIEKQALTTMSRIISGRSEEIGSTVHLYRNGARMTEVSSVVDEEGNWQIVLSADTELIDGDVLAIALNDNNGVSQLESADSQLLTGTSMVNGGNENPLENLVFHDAEFEARLELDVIYYGELYLVVPETINFGTQSLLSFKQRHKVKEMNGGALGVVDTRPAKTDWYVYAQVEQAMTHQEDSGLQLNDALVYKYNGSDLVLNENMSELVYQAQHEQNQEFYDISDSWYGNDGAGLYLELEPETAKTGSYEGVITWSLANVPMNE